MDCLETTQLRGAYIARELSEDLVHEILFPLDLCQPSPETTLTAVGTEGEETRARGPALTRHLTPEEIETERIRQAQRCAARDVACRWPMEDFNYRSFLPVLDGEDGSGWWISRRARPLDRAAWAVTLALPEGRRTRTLLLLLSLGGLYDWEHQPHLECPVRYRKPPDWFLAGRPQEPLAPIWAVVSVAALLGSLREMHGWRRLHRAARHVRNGWAHRGNGAMGS